MICIGIISQFGFSTSTNYDILRLLSPIFNIFFMDKFTFKKESKDSETTLTITVSPERFMETKNKVYNKLSQDVSIQGFRPGKAPRALIEAHISENVYNQTINTLVPEITSEIFVQEKINPLTQVSY